MEAPTRSAAARFRAFLPACLAWIALITWGRSMWLPNPLSHLFDIRLLIALVAPPAWLLLGPWAVLANVTGLWMFFRVIRGKRADVSLALTVLLPATSSTFWEVLGKSTPLERGPYLWTGGLLLGVVAALVARFWPARAASKGGPDGNGTSSKPLE